MKKNRKAFILALVAGLVFLFFTFSWTQNGIQAAGVLPNISGQIVPTPILLKQYLPIVSKAPPPPVPIGPVGGSITSLLVDPLDSNVVYAGSFGGGVLKTIDAGNTWFKSGTGMPGNSAIQSLGLIPSSPNIIFAGTNGDGLYRSVNYGYNWTKVGELFGTNVVYGISSDPNRPNVVYIVTRVRTNLCGELYRSEDWGITWNLLKRSDFAGTCTDYWYDVDVNPWDSNIIYLPFHEHGIFRSIDYGSTFNPLNTGIASYFNIIPARSMAIDTLSGRMYSGFAKATSVYVSDNRGETWQATSLADKEVLKILLSPLAQDRQRVMLATLTHGVLYSDNSGAGWNFTTLQNIVKMAYDVAVTNTNPQRWFAGTHAAGLFISTNYGASWSQAGTGTLASSIAGLATSSQLPGETIAAVYGQGIMMTSDSGQTWEELNSGLDSINVTAVYDLNGQLYALADTGVYQFDRTSWQNLSMPQLDTPNLEAYLDYSSMTFPIEKQLAGAMLSSNQEILPNLQKSGGLPGNTPVIRLASSGGQLYAGTAGDGLWVREGSLWQAVGFEGQSIADITFTPDGSLGLLAACTDDQKCLIYTHSNLGWVEASIGLSLKQITDLLIAPNGQLFATGAGGIYRFDVSTRTWQNLLETESLLTAVSCNQDGSALAAAGEGSAWHSLDGGISWQKIEGLEQSLTYTSVLFTDEGSLILGSDAGGAYKLELPKP